MARSLEIQSIIIRRLLRLQKIELDPYRFVAVQLLTPVRKFVFCIVKPCNKKFRSDNLLVFSYFLLELLYELCLFLLTFLIIRQFAFVILMFFFEFTSKIDILLNKNTSFGFTTADIRVNVNSLCT